MLSVLTDQNEKASSSSGTRKASDTAAALAGKPTLRNSRMPGAIRPWCRKKAGTVEGVGRGAPEGFAVAGDMAVFWFMGLALKFPDPEKQAASPARRAPGTPWAVGTPLSSVLAGPSLDQLVSRPLPARLVTTC